MQFKAKTEKELAEENLIPEGIYPFEVSKAEAKKSKRGNDMIELELRIFTPEGKERGLKDWLMEAMGFKLFHFCAYTGLSHKYDAGTLNSHDCEGRSGFVKIEIQEDKTGQYPPRNSVRDYVRQEVKKSGALAPLTAQQIGNLPAGVPAPKTEEDVPF